MALWFSGTADQREVGKTMDEEEDLRNTGRGSSNPEAARDASSCLKAF